jgi:hypothetical protein
MPVISIRERMRMHVPEAGNEVFTRPIYHRGFFRNVISFAYSSDSIASDGNIPAIQYFIVFYIND